jgi:hypothetical protein
MKVNNVQHVQLMRSYYDRARANTDNTPIKDVVRHNENTLREIKRHPWSDFFLRGCQVGRDPKTQEQLIERIVIRTLATSRPDIDLIHKVPQLRTQQEQGSRFKQLRLCLYCLGLYQKQAFSIDHINPVHRRLFSDHQSAQQYNEPGNLVAVCSSCNSSKGLKNLERAFVLRRIEERKAEDGPGLDGLPNQLQRLWDIFGI